ncbi:hypothetical protein MMC31_002366 [Peltigera leucophlebia]|nr:hypothetical protein [Peltigera leucophlebia]
MASTSNEINDGVDRASTTSLIQSMENPQSQEENDNPHQAIKPVDKTEGPTGSLLAMPAEIRQQIFGYLLCADKTKNCPHDRSHYLFLHPECCRRFPAIKNRAFLAALLINRQLYFEIKYILYSQNLFYFEGCLTQTYFDPPSLPQKLIAAIGTNLKQIGFPLKFGIIRSITKDASIKAAERFKAKYISENSIGADNGLTTSVGGGSSVTKAGSPAGFPTNRWHRLIVTKVKDHGSDVYSASLAQNVSMIGSMLQRDKRHKPL